MASQAKQGAWVRCNDPCAFPTQWDIARSPGCPAPTEEAVADASGGASACAPGQGALATCARHGRDPRPHERVVGRELYGSGRVTALRVHLTPEDRQTLLAWQQSTGFRRVGRAGRVSYCLPLRGCRSPTLPARWGSTGPWTRSGCGDFSRPESRGWSSRPAGFAPGIPSQATRLRPPGAVRRPRRR